MNIKISNRAKLEPLPALDLVRNIVANGYLPKPGQKAPPLRFPGLGVKVEVVRARTSHVFVITRTRKA